MARHTWITGLIVVVAILSITSTLGVAAGGSLSPPVRSAPASVTVAATDSAAAPTPIAAATTAATPAASAPAPATPASTCSPSSPASGSSLLTAANDPSWAQTIQHTQAIAAGAIAAGYPAADLHLPYLGAIPNQMVNGVLESGAQITAQQCQANNESDPAPAPAGVTYNGQNDTNGVVRSTTIDSNSVEGIMNVNSTSNLYPDALTPNRWGDQLNVILANVTIFGHRGYFFWVQSLAEYDTSNNTLSFYDATWNFTTGSSNMQPSSLASWSPTSSDYTGVWLLANTPYIYCPYPFTLALYVNSSVNAAGDQVLWYNYSVLTNGHFFANGNYDYLVFNSQAPGNHQTLSPAPFEASGTQKKTVTEGYEFDVMIGADDGTNQLDLLANVTEQVKYCSIADCTNTNFHYANVPAAVNFGSQTGETTVGLSINFVGATAYISAGPFIEHGLWNYSGQTGVQTGYTKVLNHISVSGSPLALSAQPYVFAFFESTSYTSQGYQWGPDVPVWYLMPGTYNYEIMLADYQEQTGSITVASSTVTLTAVLPYSLASGVYTPLWAFNNAQVAGISSSGAGTVSSQYVLFNNPTSSCTNCGSAPNANLSAVFYLPNDYHFSTYGGIILSGTSAYIDVNAPPSFCVHASGSTYYYLGIWFYNTSHVTLSHATGIRGWPVQTEWSFYISVPASQNPFPQGDVYVLSSTNDLIMSNNFVAIKPSSSSYVSPDQLVLHGGSGNVIWGNTFRDPPATALGATYAGIGEDEGGDLIYNNNFTIDNPVVYLPYNVTNDAECLPQCTAAPGNAFYWNVGLNTWNITPQPASNVAKTVNGFPLSGNVLGPSFTTQGGNFYWNYGRSPNNATGTYLSRFLYTDWSNIYPFGCPSVQPPGTPCGTAPPVVGAYVNGMQSGSGDFAPLTISVPITFTETGLPSGTRWAVVLSGVVGGSTVSSITFANKGTGLYPFQVATVPGYTASVVSGSVSVTGLPGAIQAITFTRTGYTVTLTEVGLPTGTSWSATLNGTLKSATTGTISFTGQFPGTLAYNVSKKAGYLISPMAGTVTVVSSAINIPVTFSKTMYAVTFTETGYSGAWAVALGNVVQSAAAGGPIVFNESNGSYAYKVAMVSGYTAAPSSGTATVAGAAVPEAITYTVAAPPTYSLQFTENGLPSGTMWSVTVTG
ncbi:MAG: thermopsin family protease, partial [Thermoplasmata archaeon]